MLLARDLIRMSLQEVKDLPDGPMRLQFDDGVLETTTRETVFSRYVWEIHRQYPNTPILKSHHIGDTRLGSGTTLKLLSNSIWDCYDAYNGQANLEHLSKLAYQITNQLYNETTVDLEEWVGSISILDFVEVMNHPKIKAIMDTLFTRLDLSDAGIEKSYAEIKAILLDPKELIGNGVAKAAKSGLVSLGQILQCVGARGLTTDIDSHIFRKPVLHGFGHGLSTLEDAMKESRSAAKALFFAKDPMAQSEYFNRNMQLAAATLRNLHMVDCGSTDFIPFMVRPGDIPCLEGMWFFDEINNKQRPITKADEHLKGKTIQLRTVFTCKHPDRYGVCVRCFGELGLSVPMGTNIGHLSSSELLGQVAQKILSTKHEDGSANIETLSLDDFEKKYMRTGNNHNQIFFNDHLLGKPFKIFFSIPEATTLPDIAYVDDVKKLTPSRISEITMIYLESEHNGVRETVPLSVSTATRTSSLTWEALEYIKRQGWTITTDERYCIDMSNWKKNAPFLELPMKHFSTVDYMFAIGAMIKGSGSKKGKQTLKNYEDISATLTALHDLVNSKLKVNISYLQTIILTMMVQDEVNRDYRLPMPRENGEIAQYKPIMARRSLGVTMAHEHQLAIMFNPESFVIKVRPSSPLDHLIMG